MAEEAPRAVPFRGGGFAPRLRHAVGAATLTALIVLWSVAARRGWISPIALPPPEEVAAALVRLARSGELARHLEASLWRLLTGFTLGALAGIGVGLAIGLVSLIRSAGVPLIAALFPIPKIALLPLFIVWFGIGEASKIATIAFGAFFPVAIATYGGVDGVDRSLIRMAQSFGLPARSIVRKIVLPGALPAVLSGLRIAASIAIILIVAAEMIGANDGIGAFILAAGNLMQTDQLVAGVLVLSLLGLTIAALIGAAERYLLRWR
ncbi:MAG TPA: ABC transporter permease [Xanthobacteraceae bacterium]|nr:ABC transporter permease [Xanthobacteraceae bacterium]